MQNAKPKNKNVTEKVSETPSVSKADLPDLEVQRRGSAVIGGGFQEKLADASQREQVIQFTEAGKLLLSENGKFGL